MLIAVVLFLLPLLKTVTGRFRKSAGKADA
jgi:hypothetical protein